MRFGSSFRLPLCLVLIVGLVFPLSIRSTHAESRYTLLDATAVQRLPDRQGALGIEIATSGTTADFPNGTKTTAYPVRKVLPYSVLRQSPIGVGASIYAVNGVLFTTPDGLPRYIRSLVPGSTAVIEYFPGKNMSPRVTAVRIGGSEAATSPPAPAPVTRAYTQEIPDETQENTTNILKWIGIGIATIGAAVLLNKMSGSGEGGGSSSQGSDGSTGGESLYESYEKQRRQNLEAEEKRAQEYDDASKGVFWGNTIDGTAVK